VIVLEKMIEKAVIAVGVCVIVHVMIDVIVHVVVVVLLNESANFYMQSNPVAKIGVECKTLHMMLSSSHHSMHR